MGIRAACRRLGGIFASLSVDVVQTLGVGIVRLQIVVADRPGRRKTAVMFYFSEVLRAQAEQGGAVELRIAADVVVRVRMQLFAVLVVPHFFRLVFTLA